MEKLRETSKDRMRDIRINSLENDKEFLMNEIRVLEMKVKEKEGKEQKQIEENRTLHR